MPRHSRLLILLPFAACVPRAFADEVIYSYEGYVFPSSSEGWVTFLGETCTQSLADGLLINSWPPANGSFGGYQKVFADVSNPPPDPPFWVEWRFASNNAIHGSYLGDGTFSVLYVGANFYLNMYGDSIISQDGGTYVLDLPLNEFRTYRFESPDGHQWCAWFEGKPFLCRTGAPSGADISFIRIAGSGGSPYATVNRWDYVRYGRLTTGETIVAANPPTGYLNPETYANLDRFTVTFDQPKYVYIDDIVVDVVGNEATRQQGKGIDSIDNRQSQIANPVVIATRRQDNGPPETIEIVLDRPLPIGQTTRFTFNTGAATPQFVEYTLAFDPHPVIPTTTTWGLVILALLLAITSKIATTKCHCS